MTAQEIKNKALATQKPKTIQSMINASIKELGKALPSHMSGERIARIATTCIRLNPELAQCTPESFMGALFLAAQTGLEPVNGRSYLLPFNNSRKVNGQWLKTKDVQFIIGYKGLVDLFYRHDSSLSIDMQEVKENDDFDYKYGTDSYINHTPSMKDRGETIAYYACAKMKGGASIFKVMSKEDVLEHGLKHSKTVDKKTGKFYEFSPWSKEFDAMAKKTVLIQLSKLLPLSVEVQNAIAADETSRSFKKGISDAMDLKDETNWDEAEKTVEAQENDITVDVDEFPDVDSHVEKNNKNSKPSFKL